MELIESALPSQMEIRPLSNIVSTRCRTMTPLKIRHWHIILPSNRNTCYYTYTTAVILCRLWRPEGSWNFLKKGRRSLLQNRVREKPSKLFPPENGLMLSARPLTIARGRGGKYPSEHDYCRLHGQPGDR